VSSNSIHAEVMVYKQLGNIEICQVTSLGFVLVSFLFHISRSYLHYKLIFFLISSDLIKKWTGFSLEDGTYIICLICLHLIFKSTVHFRIRSSEFNHLYNHNFYCGSEN
jgi:hypothetical protein